MRAVGPDIEIKAAQCYHKVAQKVHRTFFIMGDVFKIVLKTYN